MFAPPSLVDLAIDQLPRNHPANGPSGFSVGGGAVVGVAGQGASGSPRPSISRQNTSSQKHPTSSTASTAVTISTVDLVAWDQSVSEMAKLMQSIASGVGVVQEQQRTFALLHQQQQQNHNKLHFHAVPNAGDDDAYYSSNGTTDTNSLPAGSRHHQKQKFGDAAFAVEAAVTAAAVANRQTAMILLHGGSGASDGLPLPRNNLLGIHGAHEYTIGSANDSSPSGAESIGRRGSHSGVATQMPFVPVTFVGNGLASRKEVSLEPRSPDVSQHSASEQPPIASSNDGGLNHHVLVEGGATLTEALGGTGGNNRPNTPDLLVSNFAAKISELHQQIVYVQNLLSTAAVDIESFGSAFPAPELTLPQPQLQHYHRQASGARPRGFSASQEGGQSGGMHPHFLHSPASVSGPSPPSGNSAFHHSPGPSSAVAGVPTNASVFSAGGGGFPLTQLRSSVRIHQSFINALNANNHNNNNNNGGHAPSVPYHHGMSVTETLFSMMEHSMSRAPGESFSKLPIPTTTTTLTKDTDETGSKSINQYLILDVIGQGACGKVKLALDLNRGTTVAIKQVRRGGKAAKAANVDGLAGSGNNEPQTQAASPKLGRRVDAQLAALKREIAIMKKIRHKNVVALHEVIDDPHADKLYLIMQYVDQGSVGSVKLDGTCDALPLRQVADIIAQVASGLHFLHASGVVHRDIKPENILVSSEGHVYLSDFGVSTLSDRGNTVVTGATSPSFGSPLTTKPHSDTSIPNFAAVAPSSGGGGGGGGTILFMPPEHFADHNIALASLLPSNVMTPAAPQGDNSAPPSSSTSSSKTTNVTVSTPFEKQCAGDVWALGVTVYALVYGHLPFPSLEMLIDSTFTPEFPLIAGFDESQSGEMSAGSSDTAAPNMEPVPKKLVALLKAMLSREAVLRPRPHQIRSVAKLLKRELQSVEEQECSIDNDLLMASTAVAAPPGLQLSHAANSGGSNSVAVTVGGGLGKRHGTAIRISRQELADALTPAGGLSSPPPSDLLRKISSHASAFELPNNVAWDSARSATSPRSPPNISTASTAFESPTAAGRSAYQPRPPSSESPQTRRPASISTQA